MSFAQFCAVWCTTLSIHILTFWNVVLILKSNVTLLKTLNIVERFTLILSNCSTPSIDEFCKVLRSFVHNLTYSQPYLSKRCINSKIEYYTSKDAKYSRTVNFQATGLLNSPHKWAFDSFVQFWAILCTTLLIRIVTFQNVELIIK